MNLLFRTGWQTSDSRDQLPALHMVLHPQEHHEWDLDIQIKYLSEVQPSTLKRILGKGITNFKRYTNGLYNWIKKNPTHLFTELTLNDFLHHNLPKYRLTFCLRSRKRYSLTGEHKQKQKLEGLIMHCSLHPHQLDETMRRTFSWQLESHFSFLHS